MYLLFIVCIFHSYQFSFGQELKTDSVPLGTLFPLEQLFVDSYTEAISAYDPISTSANVPSEVLGTPSTPGNGETSLDHINDPPLVISNDNNDDNNTANGTNVFVSVYENTDAKSRKPVLRKCCKFGEELTKDGCNIASNSDVPFKPIVFHREPQVLGINETIPINETFHIVFGDVCQYGKYRLEPLMEQMDEFYLLDNGSLWLPVVNTIIEGSDEFCMETFSSEEEYAGAVVLPLICFPPPKEPEVNNNDDNDLKWILYPAGMLLSVPFLLIILFAYILIPKLHGTTQGKCIMCHVIALTLAYLGLAVIQLSRSLLPFDICVFIAFAVQFSFITCFAWLNVLCFDIWRRLRRNPPSFAKEKSVERKIMILYSMYATAVPLFIMIASAVMDLTPSIPASYIKPQFGVASCWFLSDDAALPYFFGPIGVMILGNFILFCLTLINIHKHKKDDYSVSSGSKKEELVKAMANFSRYMRLAFTLFILMGIGWTMEIISWAAGNKGRIIKSVWYVTDLINSLQGVMIFLIFVLDGRFRFAVRERFKQCWLDSEEHDDQPEVSILLPNLNSNHVS